jgi:hypothetical protein
VTEAKFPHCAPFRNYPQRTRPTILLDLLQEETSKCIKRASPPPQECSPWHATQVFVLY